MVKSAALGSDHTRERRELPGMKGGLLVPILNKHSDARVYFWLVHKTCEKSTYSWLVMSLNRSCSFLHSAAYFSRNILSFSLVLIFFSNNLTHRNSNLNIWYEFGHPIEAACGSHTSHLIMLNRTAFLQYNTTKAYHSPHFKTKWHHSKSAIGFLLPSQLQNDG